MPEPLQRQPRRPNGADSKSLRLHVPADLHGQMKERAADEGQTLSAWVVALVREALAK
jgi:predicted HicB family RNase H-like nuclease